MEVITLLILSYLTGSIPTSIIISRVAKNIDIREHGSGNAGATNVYRILGWKYALIVLSLDIFKAWLPTAIYATKIFLSISIPDIGFIQILCGFSAVFGHTYPIFARFKGGERSRIINWRIACFISIRIPIMPNSCYFCCCYYRLCISWINFCSYFTSNHHTYSSGSRNYYPKSIFGYF